MWGLDNKGTHVSVPFGVFGDLMKVKLMRTYHIICNAFILLMIVGWLFYGWLTGLLVQNEKTDVQSWDHPDSKLVLVRQVWV